MAFQFCFPFISGFSQNRSTSATSSEAEKMKDVEEESKIIFPPAPLINSEQASL